MPTITASKAATYAVFAVTDHTMMRVRLTEPTTNWQDVQAQWDAYDRPRLYDGRVTLVHGEPVRYFVVRDMADPQWADAPEASVMTIDFEPWHFEAKGGGPLKAVREWALLRGVKGDAGGYLRREDGSVVVQGWWNYIKLNLKALRKDETVRDAVLAHHFAPPKLSKRQRETLIALYRNGADKRRIRPGHMRTWRGPHTADMVAPASKLVEKGLLIMEGVAYGPKTYLLTGKGRQVAALLIAQEN